MRILTAWGVASTAAEGRCISKQSIQPLMQTSYCYMLSMVKWAAD